MKESGYYPPGAEFDSRAPFSEKEIPEKEFGVCLSQSLSKSTTVTTDDYVPLVEETEDGKFPYEETSNINWYKAYIGEHYTPLQLIQKFKSMLEDTLKSREGLISPANTKSLEWLIKECSDWVENDIDIIRE